MARNRFFRFFCITRFGRGPLQNLSSRSDFGFEFSEIFVIKNRLPASVIVESTGFPWVTLFFKPLNKLIVIVHCIPSLFFAGLADSIFWLKLPPQVYGPHALLSVVYTHTYGDCIQRKTWSMEPYAGVDNNSLHLIVSQLRIQLPTQWPTHYKGKGVEWGRPQLLVAYLSANFHNFL